MAYGGVTSVDNLNNEDKKKRGALLAGLGAVSALLVLFAFAASHLSQSKPSSNVMEHATNLLQIPALTEAVQRSQSLLATTLAGDKMAEVMPLKYLIERQVVDHGLHAGTISDTELAFADEHKKISGDDWHSARRHHKVEKEARQGDSSCSPFC